MARLLAVSTVVPALLVSTGTAALAATNILTLTVLNRSGAKVKISATVVNVDSNEPYTIKAGTARKLPKGTYAVLAQIATGDTTTLAGKAVKVSGSAKLTIDARQGKRVGLALSPAPAGLESQISARVCSQGDAISEVEADGGSIYVIPTTSKHVGFAALGSWTDYLGTTDSFAVLNATTGVPSNPTRTFKQSGLGTVTVDSRRGVGGGSGSDVAVQPISHGCSDRLYAGLIDSDVPTTSKIHLSPTSWDVRSDEYASATKTGDTYDIGGYDKNLKVAAGKSYSARFYAAAWGPGQMLPYIEDGDLSFGINDGFEDPAYPNRGSVEGGDKATATLQFKGKTVKTTKDTGWEPEEMSLSYKVKTSGWYTLSNVATRYYPEIKYPAGMLSTKSIATYRFSVKAKSSTLAPVYALQMTPAALNHYNQAKPKSTTDVALKLTRKSWSGLAAGKNPTVKSVTAKMSADGGKTWKSVSVKKIKGVWTAVVGNPTSGAVSLRARATYTSGAYSEVTIYRAYGIS
jgi:hypothetical protein